MKKMILGLAMIGSFSAFADTPDSVGCTVKLNTSALLSSTSTKKPTLDELWDTAEEKLILTEVSLASSGVAIVKMFSGRLEAYYSFNSQRGQIQLHDKKNGLSSQTTWVQDYEKLETGYIPFLTTKLTKHSGNLFGIKEAFNVQIECDRYIKSNQPR
jgi:hypothetical protein